jgi:multifunctional beta-oxidation protein
VLQYSTAKAGIIGLTRTLAIEGKKYGILANAIAPSAGTAMTNTVWPQEMVDSFKPDFIAPVVGFLTSKGMPTTLLIKQHTDETIHADNTETSGALFEILGGWAAQTRWQRSGGYAFPHTKHYTPEDVITKWNAITYFGTFISPSARLFLLINFVDDGRATNPSTTQEANQSIMANIDNNGAEPIKTKL